MYVFSNYDDNQYMSRFDDDEFAELYESDEEPVVEPEEEDEIDPRRECAENLLWWLKALGAL